MSRAHSYSHSRAHSPTFPSLHLPHSSFSNPSVALPTWRSFYNLSVTSPTSQLILQPFRRSTYVIVYSQTLPLIDLHHSTFSNRSFASLTSQALHLIHQASRPCLHIISCPTRAWSRDEILWSPYIECLWITSEDAVRPPQLYYHRGWWNEMKRNEWDECGELVSIITNPTFSDGDVKLGLQQLETND